MRRTITMSDNRYAMNVYTTRLAKIETELDNMDQHLRAILFRLTALEAHCWPGALTGWAGFDGGYVAKQAALDKLIKYAVANRWIEPTQPKDGKSESEPKDEKPESEP